MLQTVHQARFAPDSCFLPLDSTLTLFRSHLRVTLVKDGKKLVTSRVRQSVGTRQLGRELWAKRMATDRAVVMAKRGSSNHDKEGGAGDRRTDR